MVEKKNSILLEHPMVVGLFSYLYKHRALKSPLNIGVKDEHSRAIASMSRATNQSGVFYMGSRPFRTRASVEHIALPLAWIRRMPMNIPGQATGRFNIRDKPSPIQPIWRIGEGL